MAVTDSRQRSWPGGRTGSSGRVRTRLTSLRDTASAIAGSVLALVPHVLHHVGLLAGLAFTVGAAGNSLLFLVGLLLSVPMLRRVHRRFGTWRAPLIAVGIFAAVFSVSAFVISPAINSVGDGRPASPPPASQQPDQSHDAHHS